MDTDPRGMFKQIATNAGVVWGSGTADAVGAAMVQTDNGITIAASAAAALASISIILC